MRLQQCKNPGVHLRRRNTVSSEELIHCLTEAQMCILLPDEIATEHSDAFPHTLIIFRHCPQFFQIAGPRHTWVKGDDTVGRLDFDDLHLWLP